MRVLMTSFIIGFILFVGITNAPYLELYPLHYYIDQASLAFFIFGGIGCCFLWSRQDFKTLARLFIGRNVSAHSAQTLLINLENRGVF